MKLRFVFLVLFATVVGIVRFPSPVRADNYSLEAVPLYQPELVVYYSGYIVTDAVVTSSLEEKVALETLKWVTNTICYVSPAQIPGTLPLMRLFNPTSGDHLCTTSGSERQAAIAAGFTSEGILGYVFPKEAKVPGTVPLHRFYARPYTTSLGTDLNCYHVYSTDEQAAASPDYQNRLNYEGIAGYVWPAPTQIATLTITAPRPGNTLRGGSDYEVRWRASSMIGAVSIGYSSDAGYSWMVTDCGLANKGFATWRVPNLDTNHARMQIVWTDAASGPTNVLAIAESGADLSIKRTPSAPLPARTLQAVAVRAKPTGLNARRFSAAEIRLSWQAAKGSPKGYLIERRTGQGPFRQVANVLAPGVTYADGYISPGTSYAYRVRAYWDGASSGYSGVASVKTVLSLGAAGHS